MILHKLKALKYRFEKTEVGDKLFLQSEDMIYMYVRIPNNAYKFEKAMTVDDYLWYGFERYLKTHKWDEINGTLVMSEEALKRLQNKMAKWVTDACERNGWIVL